MYKLKSLQKETLSKIYKTISYLSWYKEADSAVLKKNN